VNPDHQSIEQYRSQVRTYLDVTGAERGLIVLMTSGTVITVMPSPRMMAA
jgi:exodeoxyribonuclease-5